MSKFLLGAIGLMVLPLSGCESEPKRPDPTLNIIELESKHDALEERVDQLERIKPSPQRPDEDAAAKRLEKLRADQRMIESNQKMLCDATQDC